MGDKNPFDTAIYVRVKRFNDTFFVLCDEYEDVGAFKGRILEYFIQTQAVKLPEEVSIDDLRLTIKNRVLENTSSCHDQQVFNDQEVYVLLRKAGTKDEFEDLKVVAGREFEYEFPTKKVDEPVAASD